MPSSNADTLFSPAALRAAAAALITPRLVLFPVRHHSPACALHLMRLWRELPPRCVLIEGPEEFTPLLPWLAHAETRPPVAIYTHAARGTSEHRDATYYPLSTTSPEWLALRGAAEMQVPCRFIDLPWARHNEMLRQRPREHSLQGEVQIAGSAALARLAGELGCRDHEELWEHLFEVPAPLIDSREHVARVLAYCLLARSDYRDTDLEQDGSLARERHMAAAIRAALGESQGSGAVWVVLGGFHAASVLDLIGTGSADAPLRPLVDDAAQAALIRYSDLRLDRLNGYASGMAAPAWHAAMLQHGQQLDAPSPHQWRHQRAQIALGFLLDLAQRLRTKGLRLSTPALSAAHEQCLRLARLRGRIGPGREDLRDAVLGTLVQGATDSDGGLILDQLDALLCGQSHGHIPAGCGTPPLVRDFLQHASRLRLRIHDQELHQAALDLYRRPSHRVTSRLFHGGQLLDLPFAMRLSGPDFVNGSGLTRLQERWQYRFTPATEAALVEASIHGNTWNEAVSHRFRQWLSEQAQLHGARQARHAVAWLTRACVLGQHDEVPNLLESLRAAIDEDSAYVSLVSATLGLLQLWQTREALEALGIGALPDLLRRACSRALFVAGGLAPETDPDAAMNALCSLRELSLHQPPLCDPALLRDLLGRFADQHPQALLRGAACALLHLSGACDEASLHRSVAGHLRGLLAPEEAVAYVRGLLFAARELAWQSAALLACLDQCLIDWNEEDFVRHLPELRLAFARLTPQETDRVAARVVALHERTPDQPVAEEPADHARVLAAAQRARAVLSGDGLAAWWPT